MKTKKMYLTPSVRTAELLESVYLMAGSNVGAGTGPGNGGELGGSPSKKKDDNGSFWETEGEVSPW